MLNNIVMVLIVQSSTNPAQFLNKEGSFSSAWLSHGLIYSIRCTNKVIFCPYSKYPLYDRNPCNKGLPTIANNTTIAAMAATAFLGVGLRELKNVN